MQGRDTLGILPNAIGLLTPLLIPFLNHLQLHSLLTLIPTSLHSKSMLSMQLLFFPLACPHLDQTGVLTLDVLHT